MIRIMTTTIIVTTADSGQIAYIETVREAKNSTEDSKAIKSNTESYSEAIKDNIKNYIKEDLSESIEEQNIEKQNIEKHTERIAISIIQINT
jgi:hypothetical protein